MMSAPKISVVMPTFRRPEMLRRAVASVLAQSFEDWELVISDDEVPAGETWPVLEELAASDPRIRVFQHSGKSGQIENNNFVMSQARGEWIKPLFDDDELKPACLSRLWEQVQLHPELSLIRCKVDLFNEVSQWQKISKSSGESVLKSADDIRLGLLRQEIRLGTPLQIMFHRRILDAGLQWRKVEGMSSAYDSDFIYRMLPFGEVLLVDESLVVQHLGHETGTALMDAQPEKLDEDLRILMRELHAAYEGAEVLAPLSRYHHELTLVRGLHRIVRYHRYKEGLGMLLQRHPWRAWKHVIHLVFRNDEFRGALSVTG
ncbi:glycosyltransferase family 2 protein [Kiritimatiellota bacterium B12222]|nr:glycosyltransferase family 2 protein [Kiritimatiellota bacterium B12222]